MRVTTFPTIPALGILLLIQPAPADEAAREEAATWRAEKRIIDLHMHVSGTDARIERAVGIMDSAGIGIGANLSGDASIPRVEAVSKLAQNIARADRVAPRRFVHYMNLDYSHWDKPDWEEHAVRQVEEGHRQGAAGLKEYKRLGLYLRDKSGELIQIDDPKLDPVWKRCGELDMPVSIHVADPKAFWLPYDDKNERWVELKDHKSWWFGDPDKYPSREALLEARNRVVKRHPETTFVCVHFGNNPEDINWVGRSLDEMPNMMVDIAARVPELGRHEPAAARALFTKHQDRIFFATDFMVYDKLILGSGGDGPGPSDSDAVEFYDKHWRWFETGDRGFDQMTRIQGDWKIDAIDLPSSVLRKNYFDNAHRLLVRSLPPPTLVAKHIEADFEVDGKLDDRAWAGAGYARIDYAIRSGIALPERSTATQVLWTDRFLYIGYSAPFDRLTSFSPAGDGERMGLWDRDVVEAFIGSDPDNVSSYTEYEVAPTGEKLDLRVDLPDKDFAWSSGFDAATHIDEVAKIWTTEMRIPIAAVCESPPVAGETVWRLNLFRHSTADAAFLGWAPTATGTAHTPERFGYLKF